MVGKNGRCKTGWWCYPFLVNYKLVVLHVHYPVNVTESIDQIYLYPTLIIIGGS